MTEVIKEICKVCTKTVYVAEKLSADGKIFHKQCFRCSHCNRTLKLGNYCSFENKLFCKPHFIQLFKSRGKYDTLSKDTTDALNIHDDTVHPSSTISSTTDHSILESDEDSENGSTLTTPRLKNELPTSYEDVNGEEKNGQHTSTIVIPALKTKDEHVKEDSSNTLVSPRGERANGMLSPRSSVGKNAAKKILEKVELLSNIFDGKKPPEEHNNSSNDPNNLISPRRTTGKKILEKVEKLSNMFEGKKSTETDEQKVTDPNLMISPRGQSKPSKKLLDKVDMLSNVLDTKKNRN